MTTKVIKTVIMTRANGEEIVITDSEKEKVRTNDTYLITCDGPRCGAHNESGEHTFITFSDEQVRQDEHSVPDGFFRFIKVQPSPVSDELKEFCSTRCLKDFIDYEYVWPLSPREKAEQMKTNATASRFDQEPVSQADGDPITPHLLGDSKV